MTLKQKLFYSLSLIVSGIFTANVVGEENAPKISSVKEFIPFAQKNCTSCHDADDQKGGFDMEDLLKNPTVEKNPAAWHAVLERLVSRDMPPG